MTRRPGMGPLDVERGAGHGFRQINAIILATSCCPMCSAAREKLSLSLMHEGQGLHLIKSYTLKWCKLRGQQR